MTSTESPTSSLAAESVATLSMHTGASMRVHGSHYAHDRHFEKRQLFDPAHALQMILDGVEELPGREKVAICDAAGRISPTSRRAQWRSNLGARAFRIGSDKRFGANRRRISIPGNHLRDAVPAGDRCLQHFISGEQ
jgi:hypothetical protein